MQLADFLRREHILAPLQAETVREAVQRLVEQLAAAGSVVNTEPLQRLVAEEYIRDVIHVGNRVLLPHMRSPAVERLVVAIGVSPTPLRMAPGDAEATAQVVVLVLAYPAATELYLQMIATLARALRSDAAVDRLVAATSPEEVLALPEFHNLVLQRRLTVRDVMTQRVFRVSPDMPVRELLDLMRRHRLNAVPVVGEKREVLGLVTDRDVLRHLLPTMVRGGGAEPEDPASVSAIREEVRVREIMTRSVMCISEDQALTEVASIMVNKDTERLPVVSEGQLTGFLTRADIISKLFGP
ncbi:MAG TPA: CBS domain-containing protein [Longimicrobiaceae bacterium]|nr:CBS domain-containing protein [Longimicrobiaceae bacterium]